MQLALELAASDLLCPVIRINYVIINVAILENYVANILLCFYMGAVMEYYLGP